jgi:uncharacterized protein YdhG (YjbR/CyaY superfamily)
MSPERQGGESEPESIAAGQTSGGFSAEERAAMKERAQELKAETTRGSGTKKDGESDVLAKIAEMAEPDRQMALQVHEIVKANAPALSARTWYGMPAYALDKKVVCFFQGAKKFNTRYATLGFSDAAHLDEGDMWATSFALMSMTPAAQKRIATLVEKAVSQNEGGLHAEQ